MADSTEVGQNVHSPSVNVEALDENYNNLKALAKTGKIPFPSIIAQKISQSDQLPE